MTVTTIQPTRILRHHKASEPQRAFWRSSARFRALIGGVGSGKTRGGCVEVLRQAPGSIGMVVAPTFPMLRDAVLRSFLDLARRGGILDSWREGTMTAQLIDGKTILFRSADDPDRLRGPNLSWFWLDEAALMDGDVWRVMLGRLRLLPGRAWVTTTPKGHNWLYDVFVRQGSADHQVIQAPTRTNPYLPAGFLGSLQHAYDGAWLAQETEGEFVDLDAVAHFLPSIALWDACQADIAPLGAQPLILALDAAVTGDTFAVVGVSRHPSESGKLALRFARTWEPRGQALDYAQIEAELRALIRQHTVTCLTYDPYQAHYLAQRLSDVVWCDPFSQGADRLEADRQLLDLIVQRQLLHDGTEPIVRAHLANADRKTDVDGRRLRLIKRQADMKIDAAVALSMACSRALRLNIW